MAAPVWSLPTDELALAWLSASFDHMTVCCRGDFLSLGCARGGEGSQARRPRLAPGTWSASQTLSLHGEGCTLSGSETLNAVKLANLGVNQKICVDVRRETGLWAEESIDARLELQSRGRGCTSGGMPAWEPCPHCIQESN